MTPEMVDLARRAVACKGWRWMRGMINNQAEVINDVDMTTGRTYCGNFDADIDALPDLTQPSTRGCMLALIRELLEEPTGCVSWYEGDAENAAGWSYVSETYGASDAMPTEAEALVVALEEIVMEEDDD